MADKITNKRPDLWKTEDLTLKDRRDENASVPNDNETKPDDFPLLNTKLYESNASALLMRERLTTRFYQTNAAVNNNTPDLDARADNLKQLFESGINKTTYQTVAPQITGLSQTDAKKLQLIYRQKTGRELLSDLANHLFMADRLKAFEAIAPERIHNQVLPNSAAPASGGVIQMNPPTDSVMWNTDVKYNLKLNGIGGNQKVSHLLQDTDSGAYIEREGSSFSTVYPEPENAAGKKSETYRAVFEVRYGNEPPEFYTYRQIVKEPTDKALGELLKLPATAPDSELLLAYMDGKIEQTKNLLADLETKRQNLLFDIQNNVGNSSDKHDQLRTVEKQIAELRNILPELETARANTGNALSGAVGKPIPLQAVLVARENGQSIPLQLYAKNMGGGKWAIVDATNPAKPRTWEGEGILPADALNAAWKKFVNGSNDLPAGQIAALQPKNLGFQAGKVWNDASAGQSTLKQWSNGLGIGSLILGGLGVAALFGPGTQGAAVPLLLASGILGGGSAGLNIADRVGNGTFQWNSSETALDMLGIVGGIASLGGVASLTGAGRTVFANGAKFTVQNLGSSTRIMQAVEQGTNVAGGILIANEYVSALDTVNRNPSLTPDQRTAATRNILAQAAAMGGLMVLGVGLTRKFTPPNTSELERLLTTAKLRPELENLVKNDLAVQKVFVNSGGEKLDELYDDFLRGGKGGKGLNVKSFGQYLGTRGYSTSLDADTTTLSEKLGGQNLELMSPRRMNQRILEITNPELHRAFESGLLPPRVRQAVEEVLNANQNFPAGIQFESAKGSLNKKLYEAIGKNLGSVNEFRQVQRMLGQNPSARGSVGEWFSRRFLTDGKVIDKPSFNRKDYVRDNTRSPGIERRQPEYLIVDGKRTVDIKTGYDSGAIDVDQLKDYSDLVNSSRLPKGKIRQLLERNGVKGSLTGHDYLFLPNADGNAESAAKNAFNLIEREVGVRNANNFRVFFSDDNGQIYQIVKNTENKIVTRLIETQLPK